MNHTTNYSLSQYEAADRVTRDAFNSDNRKIDAALKTVADAASSAQATASAAQSTANGKGNCFIETGSYAGSGTSGQANPNTLTFSFPPKLVVISADTGSPNRSPCVLGVFVRGQTSAQTNWNGNNNGSPTYSVAVSWQGNSVSWYFPASSSTTQLNDSGVTYYYAALG